MRRIVFIGLSALALLVAAGGRASAYPQFQFSSGTNTCSQCHFSPAGGGLITSWGRDEAGDTLSLGGDGSFLHGLWSPPSWLALGLDFRYAGVRNDVGGTESPRGTWFPMQGDVYVRGAFGDFSLYVTGGARGEVRPEDDAIASQFTTIPKRFMSREHYVMWRPSATGPYARLGRFYAPYGIRFVEHIYYVRRYTGYELYNETYNASGGYVDDGWELHVTAFTPPPTSFPDPLSSTGLRESGGAAYFEKRLAKMSALGAQTRVGIGKDLSRYQGGLIGKLWLEPAKLLFLGEADFIRQQVTTGASYGQNQFVSYLGVTAFPFRGLMAGVAYERFQENLAVSTTGRNAFNLQVNFFPWAHFEVVLLGRYQLTGFNTTQAPASTLFMTQLHYYL